MNHGFLMEVDPIRIFVAYFTFVNRVNAFDIVEQLIEVDRLHAELTISLEQAEPHNHIAFHGARRQQFE